MSEFKLKCNSCNKVSKHNCSDLDWECVESHEKGMGPENHYVALWEEICNCGQSKSIEFHCWEYPVGSENTTSYDIEGAELKDFDCESCPDFFRGDDENDEY